MTLLGVGAVWSQASRPARYLPWAAAFVALNVLDLVLTWCLIGADRAPFYEANPLAAAVLGGAGWAGLTGYKLACVGVVLVTGTALGRRRPAAARGLFLVGCAVVAVVVSYSGSLAARGNPDHEELVAQQSKRESHETAFLDMHRYHAQLNRTAADLLRGRHSLPAAVSEVRACLASLEYDPFPHLRNLYSGLPGDEACLAAHLVRQAGWGQFASRAEAATALRRLSREFATVYSDPLPPFAGETFRGRGNSTAFPPSPSRRGG